MTGDLTAGLPGTPSSPSSHASSGEPSEVLRGGRRIVRRLLTKRLALLGLVFLLFLALVAVLAPFIAPYEPNQVNTDAIRQPPSGEHWLGTDEVGRDVLSRLLYGGQVTLLVGIAGAMSAAILGTALGLAAGWFRGWTDTIIMRLVDIVLSFPGLLVILLLTVVIGPGIFTIVLVATLFGWPAACRVVRQVSLTTRELDFVQAATVVGTGSGQIVRRHLLPEVVPPLSVVVTVGCAGVILLEATLSFLGLGVQFPQSTWGSMLVAAQSVSVIRDAPWLWISPGVAITLTVLSINFIGDGLRDVLDPRHGSTAGGGRLR